MPLASQLALQKEADRISPRARKALLKAIGKMRSRVALMKLAEALQAKNIEKALAAAGGDDLEKLFDPFSAILRDSFEKGGKVGARFL